MATRRHVTFVVTALNRGGAETQVVRVGQALTERGWRVRVARLLPEGELAVCLESTGIPVATMSPSRSTWWLSVPRLVRLLRAERPDVLVCFMFHANVVGRLCGRLAGVPLVVSSIRNSDFGGPVREWLEKTTGLLDAVTTTNSERVARSLVERGIVKESRLEVIPNALPATTFQTTEASRRALRSRWEVAPETFLWLTVGHLYAQKDHGTLMEAFADVAGRWPAARLWIAGEGPAREELETRREELGLVERVQFLGLRRDVPELLAACDAFVLSSAWEGSPNAVLEAMHAARPVVATDVGGVANLIEDRRTGLLLPPRDPQRLAYTMNRMMAMSEEERVRIAAAGQDRVGREFGLERVVDRWESLLSSLIAGRGVHRA